MRNRFVKKRWDVELPMATISLEQEESTQKRTSNEVAGFEYKYWKTILVSLGALLAFILFLPILPLITVYKTARKSYFKNYFKTLFYYIRMFPKYILHGTLARVIRYNFFMTPNQVSERLAMRKGACTRCGKCCNQVGCLFLGKDDDGNNVCNAYGTIFWYYGGCGRYPLTQQDIDDHACPGFTFLDQENKLLYEV
jgi:hypothetical protein